MKIFGFMSLAVMLTAVSAAAQAQTMGLEHEIAQLREELQILQRQVYREKSNDLSTVGSQDVTVTIGQFDETLRQTVGRMDQLEFKLKSLEDRLNVINKDIDIRLKMIEGKPFDTQGLGAANTAETKKFQAPVAKDAPKSIIGDSIAKGEDLPAVKTQSAEEIYKQGMAAINANNNDEAAQKFTTILTKFPEHKLAGNAQYWLGEAYYAKKDYAKAAVAFAKGYEKFKSGTKGPDNILKLGMSMKELGKTAEACAAFTSLPTQFPKAEEVLKTKAKAMADALKCK